MRSIFVSVYTPDAFIKTPHNPHVSLKGIDISECNKYSFYTRDRIYFCRERHHSRCFFHLSIPAPLLIIAHNFRESLAPGDCLAEYFLTFLISGRETPRVSRAAPCTLFEESASRPRAIKRNKSQSGPDVHRAHQQHHLFWSL